nr:hypothetical protein [uncultured Prevotella sp.]
MNIDNNILKGKIKEIAQNDLKIISASSLKLYATDVQDTFVKYISSQIKNTYNELVDSISEEKQIDFINLNTGYVVSMKNWIKNNPMVLPKIDIEDNEPEQQEGLSLREIVKKKEVQIVGVGTAMSFILLVSGLKVWALLAESLAIAYGIYEHNNQQERKRSINLQKEKELQHKINTYIASVEEIALKWAADAEIFSNSLLVKYK